MSKAERGPLQCLSALRMYACTQEQTNSNTRTFAGVHGRQSNRKQRAFSHHGMSEVTLNAIFVPIILPSDAHLIEIQSQPRVGQSQREGLKQARETTGLQCRLSSLLLSNLSSCTCSAMIMKMGKHCCLRFRRSKKTASERHMTEQAWSR